MSVYVIYPSSLYTRLSTKVNGKNLILLFPFIPRRIPPLQKRSPCLPHLTVFIAIRPHLHLPILILQDKNVQAMSQHNSPNPFSGFRSPGFRFRFSVRKISRRALFLPLQMKSIPAVQRLMAGQDPLSVLKVDSIQKARESFNSLRMCYDFAFWAATKYIIRDVREADKLVPLVLNENQHHIINVFQRRYFHKLSGRYIITKRDPRIGVTTCVQAYMLWLQLFSSHVSHSYTCGESGFANRRWTANIQRYFKIGNSHSVSKVRIPGGICMAIFNSFRNPDAPRGMDVAYVHLANMSSWHDPGCMLSIRAHTAAISGVLPDFYTLIVIEGDIPDRKYFKIEENYDIDASGILVGRYRHICSNPFFLRLAVENLDPTYQDPYYHTIPL